MNILVTGASGGMGQATCRLFARAGHRVWGLDLAEREAIPGVRLIPTDLADPASVSAAFAAVSAETGHLDAVIHMAGIYDLNSLLEMPEEAFQRIFQVNLFAVYRVNKTFLPLLKESSRIVITSSELAPLDPLPFTGIYGVTKAALEKYAYSLRMEANLLGLKVSVLRPGAVKTPLLKTSTDALSAFSENTTHYIGSAAKFRRIVDAVEARSVSPEQIAKTAYRAVFARHPRYVYCVNRNPLLLLFNALPDHLQTALIKLLIRA